MSTYPRAGLQRILAGSAEPKLRVTLRDQDGEPVAAAGTLTVQVDRVDGTAVLPAGTATSAGEGPGAYTVTIPTADADLVDVMKATWSDGSNVRAVTYHRFVGGFLVSRTDLRARDGVGSDPTDPEIDAVRFAVEDLFENETGVAWCPMYDLEQFTGDGSTVWFPRHRPVRTVRSITIDDIAQTLDDVDIDDGWCIEFPAGFSTGSTVVVGFEHGYDNPPADLKREALVYGRFLLLGDTSGISPRARQIDGNFGTISYSYAGPGHPTGIDSVDTVLRANDRRRILH